MDTLVKTYTAENGLQLELHRNALNHTLLGDITDRVNRGDRVTTIQRIIKGGLHSYKGWEDFRKLHADVEHICFFDPKKHSAWYYARELQNEVVILRVPKLLFSSSAARITMFPDNYYKSGYLWKTLFPKGVGENELLDLISETLNNIDNEASGEGQIVGYARLSKPLKTIRIIILHRENKIQSVFPSWTQPNTGNNGKSYSHFESIGHVISASTIFFDDENTDRGGSDSTFIDSEIGLQSLVDSTPAVFITRPKPSRIVKSWKRKHTKTLLRYAATLDEENLLVIFNYVTDFEISKNFDLITKSAYNKDIANIIKLKKYFNTFQIHQNIIDGLFILHSYDISNRKHYFKNAIVYLLQNMVTFLGIDSWAKRRIFVCISALATTYYDSSASEAFLINLAEAPTRREFYVEFSIDSQLKKELKGPLKGIPDELNIVSGGARDTPIKYKHYIEYIKENLGESIRRQLTWPVSDN